MVLLALVAGADASDASTLKAAIKDRDPHRAAAICHSYVLGASRIGDEELLCVMRLLLREDVAHQVRQGLALSEHTERLCELMMRIDAGNHLAARVLATDAVMRYAWDEAARRAPEPDEDEEEPADPPTGTLASYYAPREPPADGPDTLERRTGLLVRLLAHGDWRTREAAAIAAAFYAADGPELRAAMREVGPDQGAIPGARVLYRARLGLPVAAEELRAALTITRRQPRPIERVGVELCLGNVVVPSACLAAEAAGLLGERAVVPDLGEALRADDLRVQIDAARALGRIGDPAATEGLLARLRECEWPVFIHATEALAGCPSRAAVIALIPLLDRLRGRYRQQAIYALSAIAGHQYGRTTPEKWREWWEREREAFRVDPEASAAFRATHGVRDLSVESDAAFYNLPIVSNRLVYVVDISGSMSGEKIENLREAAATSLNQLAAGTWFNIIPYDHQYTLFNRNGMTRDRRRALAYVAQLAPQGGTNIYDPTWVGMCQPGADTVYLLTDGSPGSGEFTDWYHITASFTFLCRYRPVAFNTVSFDAGERVANEMERLAEMNRGRHESL